MAGDPTVLGTAEAPEGWGPLSADSTTAPINVVGGAPQMRRVLANSALGSPTKAYKPISNARKRASRDEDGPRGRPADTSSHPARRTTRQYPITHERPGGGGIRHRQSSAFPAAGRHRQVTSPGLTKHHRGPGMRLRGRHAGRCRTEALQNDSAIERRLPKRPRQPVNRITDHVMVCRFQAAEIARYSSRPRVPGPFSLQTCPSAETRKSLDFAVGDGCSSNTRIDR